MISPGSTVILRTKDAIYSPCTIIAISEQSITITYVARNKKDRATGKYSESRPVETILRKDILSLSSRL